MCCVGGIQVAIGPFCRPLSPHIPALVHRHAPYLPVPLISCHASYQTNRHALLGKGPPTRRFSGFPIFVVPSFSDSLWRGHAAQNKACLTFQ